MAMLPALMLTLTLAVLITVAPRIVFTWMQFKELAAEDNREELLTLLQQENGWVVRHFACALLGIGLVAMMKTMPTPDLPENLAAVTAVYVVMSFAFALAESLLAQKIAPLVTGMTTPVKATRH
jgi:hypothetical protein